MLTQSTFASDVWKYTRNGSIRLKCEIALPDGVTFYDLCALHGHDWVAGVTIGAHVDQPVASAEIALYRDIGKNSLAVLNETSRQNLIGGSYAPLIYPGRKVYISGAVVAPGKTPTLGEWVPMFSGEIDSVDWASSPVVVQCRDLACKLQDAFIEDELIYGLSRCHELAPEWEASHAYAAGDVVTPVGGGDAFEALDSATSGSDEPEWGATWGLTADDAHYWAYCGQPTSYGCIPWHAGLVAAELDHIAYPSTSGDTTRDKTTLGVVATTDAGTTGATPDFDDWGVAYTAEITDGGATHVPFGYFAADNPGTPLHHCIRQLMIDNVDSTTLAAHFDLWVPTAPSFNVRPYTQGKMSLLDACRRLAALIGWDLRYRYNETDFAWQLCLYGPDRTPSNDYSFLASEYTSVDNFALSRDGVRNVVRVVYTDRSAVPTNGSDYPRAVYETSDATSITTYGRRFAEISEASVSQIDTAAEAQALAEAVLSDLKDPVADKSVTMPLFPWVEINDHYQFIANNVHATSNVSLAVVGYRHTFANGTGKTQLMCRGVPTAGFSRWHEMISRPGAARVMKSARVMPVAKVESVLNAAKLSTVKFTPPDRFYCADVYVSASASFTASSATWYGRIYATTATIAVASAGDYYVQIVALDADGNSSSPSREITISPT